MPIHTVHLFGHYRDYYVDGVVNIELIEGSTVRDAAETLISRDQRFEGILGVCRFAVEDAYATLETPIPAGASLALIPPVSGG
jgi:molybdopterin converting factor small subunit